MQEFLFHRKWFKPSGDCTIFLPWSYRVPRSIYLSDINFLLFDIDFIQKSNVSGLLFFQGGGLNKCTLLACFSFFFFLFFFFNLFYLFIFLASGVVCIVSVFPRRDMVQEYIKYRHLPNHAIFMYQSCQREPKNFTFTFFFLFFFFSYFIAIQF